MDKKSSCPFPLSRVFSLLANGIAKNNSKKMISFAPKTLITAQRNQVLSAIIQLNYEDNRQQNAIGAARLRDGRIHEEMD